MRIRGCGPQPPLNRGIGSRHRRGSRSWPLKKKLEVLLIRLRPGEIKIGAVEIGLLKPTHAYLRMLAQEEAQRRCTRLGRTHEIEPWTRRHVVFGGYVTSSGSGQYSPAAVSRAPVRTPASSGRRGLEPKHQPSRSAIGSGRTVANSRSGVQSQSATVRGIDARKKGTLIYSSLWSSAR